MIADPYAVAARWPTPRIRMLAELAVTVTATPWLLSPDHHARARAAGLDDAELLHAIALSSYFGHLNRIADAVAVPLDYDVMHRVPHAEPATPPYLRAPAPRHGAPALDIATRPATATALTAWDEYVRGRDPSNAEIAAWVSGLLGDGPAVADDGSPRYRLVEQVTLAPWQLDDAAFAALRAIGQDDAAVFDVCAAAASFGVSARIRVALSALAG